jgi:uncharacterized protein YqjF (DUF2071 family)
VSSRPFLTAEWRHLAMLNYEVDPGVLLPLMPTGTELDTWQDRTYVSVVGFLFLRTRVLGLPVPFHVNFEEVNLRFYVRREGADGLRRGVVFVKEIVPRWAIAAIARWVYGERYVALPMDHDLKPDALGYGWRRNGRREGLVARSIGASRELTEGSEEEFITEHYWGYTAQRDGGTVEYAVEHPRWSVRDAGEAHLDADVAALYGPSFEPFLRGEPRSAFVADGSPIVVRRGVRIA